MVIPCRGAEDRKGAGTNSGKFVSEAERKVAHRRVWKVEDSHYQKQSGEEPRESVRESVSSVSVSSGESVKLKTDIIRNRAESSPQESV